MRLAAVLCALAGPALAQGHPCDGAMNQLELNECSWEGFRRADADLNDAYAAAIAGARSYDAGGGSAEASLRAAQRAWVAFRDADCEAWAATWEGGSGQPMIHNGCLERLTVQRAADLWGYAEQWGG